MKYIYFKKKFFFSSEIQINSYQSNVAALTKCDSSKFVYKTQVNKKMVIKFYFKSNSAILPKKATTKTFTFFRTTPKQILKIMPNSPRKKHYKITEE